MLIGATKNTSYMKNISWIELTRDKVHVVYFIVYSREQKHEYNVVLPLQVSENNLLEASPILDVKKLIDNPVYLLVHHHHFVEHDQEALGWHPQNRRNKILIFPLLSKPHKLNHLDSHIWYFPLQILNKSFKKDTSIYNEAAHVCELHMLSEQVDAVTPQFGPRPDQTVILLLGKVTS